MIVVQVQRLSADRIPPCQGSVVFTLVRPLIDSYRGHPALLRVCRFKRCVSSIAQLCQTLCDPMSCSPPGSSVHGIFPRQEYWSGLPLPPPGDPLHSGIEPVSLASPALAGGFFTTAPSERAMRTTCVKFCQVLREASVNFSLSA